MKFVLLLGVLLVGAYAQSASNWDLTSVETASADWTKSAAVDRSNQGYTARYTHEGKLLKLSLPVHKEKNVRVTDTDRLLFGMGGASAEHEAHMANFTVSRQETANLCERALGSKWESMVQLPAEDLTYLESLRLAASLNEYNLLAAGDHSKKTRAYHEHESHYPSNWDCICHATHHRFPWTNHGVYWGVRLLKKTQYTHPAHLDCVLCNHNEVNQDDTSAGFEYDCRWCCYGECVVGETLPTTEISGSPWRTCDIDFEYDQERTDTDDPTYNYYRLNDVGNCRLPRVYHCVEEVERYCETCDAFLTEITSDAAAFAIEAQHCRYCDLVVGANPHICHDCNQSLDSVLDYSSTSPGFRNRDSDSVPPTCDCGLAMSWVTNQSRRHEGDHYEGDHEYDGYENYDYDYDYRGDGYESHDYDYRGDGYESNDYDYRRPYDYDYRGDGYESHDYDYRGDGYESNDYDYRRPYDYDYRGDGYESHDYDYRSPYDYDYRGDGYESHDYDYRGDGYESHDYDYRRPYDYDYRGDGYSNDYDYDYRRPSDYDYDYRADGYESHEYVQDHYVHPQGAGYDYRGDGYESHDYRRPYDYDYRGDGYSNDYDYDYRRPSDYDYDYDFDFRAGGYYDEGDNDYDYRRPADYDYDYRGDGYESHDYDYRGDGYESHDYRYESHEGDHYESHDYDYRRPYDYDYRG